MGVHNLPYELRYAKFPETGKAFNVPGVGYLIGWGEDVPADSSTGWAPGALFFHTVGTPPDGVWYQNQGNSSASNFDAINITIV